MKIFMLLFTLGALTTPALAFEIEEIGLLQATFGEESITQPTVIAKADGQISPTAFLNMLGGGFSSLSLTGFNADNTRLDIGATFQADVPGPQTAAFQLDIQFKTPKEKGYWTSDGATTAASIAFTMLAHDGTEGRAVGSFNGALCYAEDYGSDADTNNCRPIAGSFDTRFFVE